jgi:hypothetical protein
MIKYIGQHIFDFIARFRNDVYLENIADGTVDSDKFLGLDSNNKIVKETVSAGGATISNDANDRITTAMGNGNLNAEANLTWNNLQLGLEYSGADGPTILLTKTGDNATAPIINFVAQRAASGGAANNDDDYLGYTRYWGYNNAGTPEAIKFAEIQAQISERDDGVEEGRLDLLVQAQGALRTGFSCVGNGSAVVDTTIGTGSTSTTTVSGGLVVTTGLSVNVASGSQKPIGMQIARRTITTGEANSMHSTPIELIPAQGANTIIEISNVIARADRASAQLNSGLTMDVHYADKEPGTYGSASLAHFRRYGYGETTDFIERRVISQTTSGLTLTEDVNKAVEISFSAAASTDCFTSIDMYVTYFVIDIS